MNIIMSVVWQATGFILLCLAFIVIGLNCTLFADFMEDEVTEEKNKKYFTYWYD